MRNAIVIPTVLIVTLFISILIGTYMTSSSVRISNEYYKDLAEARGYWGAYGAKELNSSITYNYTNYTINITKNGNDYNWSLVVNGTSSGITNDDLYNRKITVVNADSNESNSTDITQYRL